MVFNKGDKNERYDIHKVNSKFIPLGVQLAGIINLNSIEVDDSDNIKNQDNCSVKLPGE